MYEGLDEVLNALLEAGGDSVTLEWVAEGLEVTMYHGSTGLGSVVPRPLAGAIMREVAVRVARSKGRLKAKMGDGEVDFRARVYDCFGESAFEIRVGEGGV